jgi:alpha-mannosidase
MTSLSSAVLAPMVISSISRTSVRIFNTTIGERNEDVSFPLPQGWKGTTVWDSHHHLIPGQPVLSDDDSSGITHTRWLIRARVPSMGFTTYTLEQRDQNIQRPDLPAAKTGEGSARATLQPDGTYKISTDLYSILVDPAKGGTIKSLVAKRLKHKEWVDPRSPRSFGELRGNFYNEGGFRSSTESPAQIRILENGPLRVRWEVDGKIAGTAFRQLFTVSQGERRIDTHLEIDWQHNTGIGQSPETLRAHTLDKAFYNDSFKLQALFPVSLPRQKIYRNAPFDVLQSRLPSTFFNSWDSIKNVVLLNWVDLTDGSDESGMALLSDHTTSYSHGPQYPLGLTVQYSGKGVFDCNYTLQGRTVLNYALVPHDGKWDKAGIWTTGARWNEPLLAKVAPCAYTAERSMLKMDAAGWDLSSMTFANGDLLVRFFNAEGNAAPRKIYFEYKADSVSVVALNGHTIRYLPIKKEASGQSFVELAMPRFGIRTLRFTRAKNADGHF